MQRDIEVYEKKGIESNFTLKQVIAQLDFQSVRLQILKGHLFYALFYNR